MSEDDRPDGARARPHRMVVRIGANVFAAWQARDLGARNEVWERIFVTSYPFAVAFCRPLAPDDLAAEEWGADAIGQAFREVDASVHRLAWLGDEQFTGMLVTRIKQRVLDGYRAHLRGAKRMDDPAAGAGDDRDKRVENATGVDVDPEVGMRTREAIAATITRLARERTQCRERQALVDVLDAKIAYVHGCCARAARGADIEGRALDEILPLVDPQAFEVSSVEMNQFVAARLKIKTQTLYDRLREIREHLGLTPGCGECDVSTAL